LECGRPSWQLYVPALIPVFTLQKSSDPSTFSKFRPVPQILPLWVMMKVSWLLEKIESIPSSWISTGRGTVVGSYTFCGRLPPICPYGFFPHAATEPSVLIKCMNSPLLPDANPDAKTGVPVSPPVQPIQRGSFDELTRFLTISHQLILFPFLSTAPSVIVVAIAWYSPQYPACPSASPYPLPQHFTVPPVRRAQRLELEPSFVLMPANAIAPVKFTDCLRSLTVTACRKKSVWSAERPKNESCAHWSDVVIWPQSPRSLNPQHLVRPSVAITQVVKMAATILSAKTGLPCSSMMVFAVVL